MTNNCQDCNLPLEGLECENETQPAYVYWKDGKEVDPPIQEGTMRGHPGLCCDCFDESWGMVEEYRARPRPKNV